MTKYRRQSDNWPYHVSCGGVVIYRNSDPIKTVVLFRKRYHRKTDNHYHLPKGTLHDNESLEECALREIREETGLRAKLIGYLGGLRQVFKTPDNLHYDKIVHYFLCQTDSLDTSAMDSEHDEARWVSLDDAGQLLNGPKHEDEIIDRAKNFLKK